MSKKNDVQMPPELMDKVHQCGQELLDVFVQICEENSLKYYLIAGTLLGAIRHKGPIPWDDDVDVCMPRADLERFIQIMLARPEGELYHIQSRENDPECPLRLTRLLKRGTVHVSQAKLNINSKYMELWMDIFPLDDASGIIDWQYRWLGWRLRKMKVIIFNKATVNTEKMNLKSKLLHFFLRPIPFKCILAHDRKLMLKNNGKGYDHYVSWGSGYHFLKQTMSKSWYEPATKVLYRGKYYNAPGEWDKVLTQLYGDYMQLPSEDKRNGHDALEIRL